MKAIIAIDKSDYTARRKHLFLPLAKSTAGRMTLFLTGLLLVAPAVFAQLRAADIFSDNMVLQRDQPVHIWGKGKPGDTILAAFSGEERTAIVKADSSWSVYFRKHNANAVPQTICIKTGRETITFKNILVGDVWLCLGQSNMEWPMIKEMHFETEIKHASQPLIRLYNPEPA